MKDDVKEHPTKHCKITITAAANGYTANYEPKVIQVTKSDTIVSFRLETPTPDDLVIDSVTIKQLGQSQLSKPTVSPNGKHVVLTDVNTEKGAFNLSFTFKSKKDAAVLAKCEGDDPDPGDQYPIIDNNPP